MNLDLSQLKTLRIGVLGYGAQGSAEAKNLKRSGVDFTLGLRTGSSFEKAKRDGFSPVSFEDCIASSDVLMMNLPDQHQGEIYEKYLAKNRKNLKALVFAHGFASTFKKIPVESDGPPHVLIAPKGAASGLVTYYGTENALPAILAWNRGGETSVPAAEKIWIEQLALALGCHPKALIWANIKDEAVCDLFSEQVLLCGGVSSLLQKSYEVLTENGYHPEAAYFETLFELKLIVDLIWKEGISGMRSRISPTARYGDITRGSQVIDDEVKKKMTTVLKQIESGEFANEFLKKIDSQEFKDRVQTQANHPIEIIGAKLRERMRS